MSLFVQETRSYEAAADAVRQAALGAIEGLGGKLAKQDAAAGTLQIKFDKKILGKVLGDRTQLDVVITQAEDGPSVVVIEAFPLNAVGQRLQFGARAGVTETVVTWFIAHLEHRLKPPPPAADAA